MKSIATISLLFFAVVAVPYAVGQRSADKPAGVDGTNWVPINENLGIVLVQPTGANAKAPMQGDRQGLYLAPPSNGYFMVRTGNHWRRLVVIEPLRGSGDAG